MSADNEIAILHTKEGWWVADISESGDFWDENGKMIVRKVRYSFLMNPCFFTSEDKACEFARKMYEDSMVVEYGINGYDCSDEYMIEHNPEYSDEWHQKNHIDHWNNYDEDGNYIGLRVL